MVGEFCVGDRVEDFLGVFGGGGRGGWRRRGRGTGLEEAGGGAAEAADGKSRQFSHCAALQKMEDRADGDRPRSLRGTEINLRFSQTLSDSGNGIGIAMSGQDTQHPTPALSKMSLNDPTAPPSNDAQSQQSAKPAEQIVNPFEVVAADEHGIDYDKLIETFGTRKIDQAILDRFEKLTGKKPHRYLRRGLFFSQR
jgi:hypothetical protein